METDAAPSNQKAPSADWDAIFADVNAWRGACMHHFSTVEMAVTETLLTLAKASSQSEKIRLRQLIGQRFEDLAAAIGPEGPFSAKGHAAFAKLTHYREHQESFRALLCHGAIKVAVDQSCDWLLVIRSLSIRSRQSERGLVVMERIEAQSRLADLKREGQHLASILGQLRKAAEA